MFVHFVHLSESESSNCLPFLQLFTILLLIHHSLLFIHSTLFVNYTLFVNNGCFAYLLQLSGHMSHLHFLSLQYFIDSFDLSVDEEGLWQVQLGDFFLDLGVDAVGGGLLPIVSFVFHRAY
jgi:hypothetical protein